MKKSGYDPITGVTMSTDYSIKFSLTPNSTFHLLSRRIPNGGAGSIGCWFKIEYSSTLSNSVETNDFFISYREINGKTEFRGDYGDTIKF